MRFLARYKRLHIWLLADLACLAAFWLTRGDRAWMNALAEHVTTPLRRALGRMCYRVDFSVAEVLCVLLALFAAGYLVWSVAAVVRARDPQAPPRPLRRQTVLAVILAVLLLQLGLTVAAALGRRPWSLLAVMLGPWLAGAAVFLAAAVLRDPARRPAAYRAVLGAVCVGVTIYAAMCLLWGVDYYTDGFQDRSGIYAQPVAAEDLEAVTAYFADRLNETADAVPRDENGLFAVPREEILKKSVHAYDWVERQFPFLAFDDPGVKPVHFSRAMSALDFTGFYCPFTGESNVNVDSPACMLPSTAAHELAHQRSVSSEQECNFLAVLAATTCGDGVYAYSGWLLGYVHLGNALYRADRDAWRRVRDSLPETVLADLADNNAYWAQFQDSPVQQVSNKVYDGFLKSYGEEKGLQSYGTVVDLLVVYYRERLDG